MENLIDEITERLQLVNKMMVSKCVPDEVTFTDALVLVQFFHDFQHTNLLIDAAESLAKGGVQTLMESAAKLRDAVAVFVSLDKQMWRQVDYIRLEEEYLAPYRKEWDTAKDASTKLWQQFQSESNRLDMMDFNSEEYHRLDVQCEQSRRAYEDAHKQTDKLYGIYREKQVECAHVHYFDMQFLEILVAKVGDIAQTVILDAKRMEGIGT